MRGWPGRDDGVTLVELLVVMILLPIILGMTSVALTSAEHLENTTQMRGDAQNANRVALEFVTRLLRQGTYPEGGSPATNSTIITDAEKAKVVFTSRLSGTGDTGPGVVSPINQYLVALVGTDLQWGSAGPTLPCSGVCSYATPSASHVVASGVRNALPTVCPTASGMVFQYYQLNPDGTLSQPMAVPITDPSQLKTIVGVQVDLWTKTKTTVDAPGACEHISGFADLRNVQ